MSTKYTSFRNEILTRFGSLWTLLPSLGGETHNIDLPLMLTRLRGGYGPSTLAREGSSGWLDVCFRRRFDMQSIRVCFR